MDAAEGMEAVVSKGKTTEIVIGTALLEAVAKWTHDELDRPNINQVMFRDDHVIATDGHRLVSVPIETHGLEIGVSRWDVMAAVAAQRALEPSADQIRVEVVTNGKYPRLLLRLSDGDTPMIVTTPASGEFPTRGQVSGLMLIDRGTTRPEVFNPCFHAAIHEVASILGLDNCGVRVVGWDGALGPNHYEGPLGSHFVVMPMRDP